MTLADCLAALTDAVAVGERLGLPTDDARAVLARADERLGFPGSAYVLALAGGTGVGKSSLLNALAGRTVSAVRSVRPTTDEPVAWVAELRRDELQPLMEWLGARHVIGHAERELAHVAILDLPDFDSIRLEHRATVEELLPRVDALAWVLDPEKYDDARLHDGYLRPLARHADRFSFVLNKADRLAGDDRETVRRDLKRRLAAVGIEEPRIYVLSARDGNGELRAFAETLRDAADAKGLIAAKLAADARAAAHELAALGGVHPRRGAWPLVSPDRRRAALSESVAGALATVDLKGLREQAQGAVRERARRTGAGLIGRVTALANRVSGRATRRADPVAYLRSWRARGTLARAANPIRQLAGEAALSAPAAWRPRLMEEASAERVERTVAAALDHVAAREAEAGSAPGSWLWPLLGLLQLAANGVLLFGLLWYATVIIAPGTPITTREFPLIGEAPLPLMLVATGAAASYLLALLLGAHAGWLGRRWARDVAGRVSSSVADALERQAMAGIDELEEERRMLAALVERIDRDCG